MSQLSPDMQAILDATRQGLKEAEAKVAQLRNIETMLLGNGVVAGPLMPKATTSPSRPAVTMTLWAAAEKILKESGEPMNTDVIAKQIIEQKLYAPKSGGGFRDFANTLFSTLRRKDDVFFKDSPGMWGLVIWKNQ